MQKIIYIYPIKQFLKTSDETKLSSTYNDVASEQAGFRMWRKDCGLRDRRTQTIKTNLYC